MKKLLTLTLLLCIALPSLAAEDDNASYAKRCIAEAKEVGVAAEDMDNYVADCIDSMREEHQESMRGNANSSHN